MKGHLWDSDDEYPNKLAVHFPYGHHKMYPAVGLTHKLSLPNHSNLVWGTRIL